MHIEHIRFVEGDAHHLPLADYSVDVLACRLAAHHFVDVPQVIREWKRLLKPAGKLLLIDSIGAEDAELDAFIHEIEVLRDPSHVRNYAVSTWLEMLKAVGIEAHVQHSWGIHMDVPTWTQRQRTSPQHVERILQLFATARPDVRQHLHIEQQHGIYSFDLPAALIVGTVV
ncbi:hypothetical protein KDA_60410 [Dictyobacter alpinus]|uniref:Methyltransferase type 11 domain-containing protein n=1 Tax=Dictyobacter alpinus TaxID=2014873 RepID=A0A402BH37_9CHLR|nr:class I SAM-dependent methyltransferase [Dictyobacter alpinus]GCE30557.1 hypothetical protein KDA_60410 [Dictyobacter alpinus]